MIFRVRTFCKKDHYVSHSHAHSCFTHFFSHFYICSHHVYKKLQKLHHMILQPKNYKKTTYKFYLSAEGKN